MDRDAGVREGGSVVGMRGFEIADGAPEFAVSFARELGAAGTFIDPGSVGFR